MEVVYMAALSTTHPLKGIDVTVNYPSPKGNG